MHRLRYACLFIFSILAMQLQGQQPLRIGMTAEEFRTAYPGVLPAEVTFCAELTLREKLHGTPGEWVFSLYDNQLTRAQYISDNKINNVKDFAEWVHAAQATVTEYTSTYGPPISVTIGPTQYIDHSADGFVKRDVQREVYAEAIWETPSMRITLTCDYDARKQEFNEFLPNSQDVKYTYEFHIHFVRHNGLPPFVPEDNGKLQLGMTVDALAKLYPKLFPRSVKMNGLWCRIERVDGLDLNWCYSFQDGKLSDWGLRMNSDTLTADNFQRYLTVTRRLLAAAEQEFGAPKSFELGDTTFVHPATHHHWGYLVLDAEWRHRGMQIQLTFEFHGGKGQYFFGLWMDYYPIKE